MLTSLIEYLEYFGSILPLNNNDNLYNWCKNLKSCVETLNSWGVDFKRHEEEGIIPYIKKYNDHVDNILVRAPGSEYIQLNRTILLNELNELNDIKYIEKYFNASITLNIILVFSIILMIDINIIDIPVTILKNVCNNLLSYAGYKPEDIEYYNDNYVITEDILKIKQELRKFKKEVNKTIKTDIFNISMDLNNIKNNKDNDRHIKSNKEYVEFHEYKRELFNMKDNIKILTNDISTLKRNMVLCISDNDKL